MLAKVAHGLLRTPVGELNDWKLSKWQSIIANLELLKYDLSWMHSHFDIIKARMEVVKAQERLKLAQVKVAALEQALILANKEVAKCTSDLEGQRRSTSGVLHFDKVVEAGLL